MAADLATALARAGKSGSFRKMVFEALRAAEAKDPHPAKYRAKVRVPLVEALLADARYHEIELAGGLRYEIGLDSRIERALLFSRDAAPDHVWEPQTTKLLVKLAQNVRGDVMVGGAYIGDQVVPLAKALAKRGKVHAFEPMAWSYGRLLRHIELNKLPNVVPNHAGLWDNNGTIHISGEPALSTSAEAGAGETVPAFTADEYVAQKGIHTIGLIMLDTEGGEERALRGAAGLLARPAGDAPDLVFEIHRHHVDWSEGLPNTSVLKFLADFGYEAYAVRDYHDNVATAGMPIEVIPAAKVYLEGPPHGFNMFASKRPARVAGLGLVSVSDVSPKLFLDKDPALHAPKGRA